LISETAVLAVFLCAANRLATTFKPANKTNKGVDTTGVYMANDEKMQSKIDWKIAGGAGGLASVILAFSINTAKDAQIALGVTEQHGQELLMMNQSIVSLRNEMRSRTSERYTAKDADRDFKYIEARLLRCEKFIDQETDQRRQ